MRRVLYFGGDRFSSLSLQQFIKNAVNCDIHCVSNNSKSALIQLASQLNLTHSVCPARSLSGWNTLPSTHPSWDIGIVSSFALFIPERIIKSFTWGMINIHPSLLPKYRGPSPIQSAILAGEERFGVSIIDLHPKTIDAGHIVAATDAVTLPTSLFYPEIEARLAEMGGELAAAVVNDWDRFWPQRTAQMQAGASHTRKFENADGIVSFGLMTSAEIWNIFRALGHQLPIKARLTGQNRWVFLEDPVLGPAEPMSGPPGSTRYRRPILWVKARDGQAVGFKQFKLEGKSSIFPAGSFCANFLAKYSVHDPCFQ